MRDMFEIDESLSGQLKSRASTGSETGGFIIRDGNRIFIWDCKNQSGLAENFLYSARDYSDAKKTGELLANWHTHPDESTPSDHDVKISHALNLPIIVVTASGKIYIVDPKQIYGNEFQWNVEDCYTTVMRYYQRLGIWLEHFVRWDNFWNEDPELIPRNLAQQGFVLAGGDDYRLHDGLIIPIIGKIPNHFAVISGMNRITHHFPMRLSIEQPIPEYFLTRSVHVRHKDFISV